MLLINVFNFNNNYQIISQPHVTLFNYPQPHVNALKTFLPPCIFFFLPFPNLRVYIYKPKSLLFNCDIKLLIFFLFYLYIYIFNKDSIYEIRNCKLYIKKKGSLPFDYSFVYYLFFNLT